MVLQPASTTPDPTNKNVIQRLVRKGYMVERDGKFYTTAYGERSLGIDYIPAGVESRIHTLENKLRMLTHADLSAGQRMLESESRKLLSHTKAALFNERAKEAELFLANAENAYKAILKVVTKKSEDSAMDNKAVMRILSRDQLRKRIKRLRDYKVDSTNPEQRASIGKRIISLERALRDISIPVGKRLHATRAV